MFKRFFKKLVLLMLPIYAVNASQLKENKSSVFPFLVSASLITKDGYELLLKLHNNSGRVLKFNDGLLRRNNINLFVSGAKPFGSVLDELAALDNSFGFTEIDAGAIYSHRLNLVDMYPSLLSKLKKGNLILFWSTEVKTVEKDESKMLVKRFGGYILVKNNEEK